MKVKKVKGLLLKAFVDRIQIYDGNTLIAQHKRCYDRYKEVFNFDHYLDLLAIRPGAVPYARPLIHAKLAPIYREFEKRLIRTSQGCREYIQILKLLRKYSKDDVEKALKEAAFHNMYFFEYVQQILYRMNEVIPNIVPLAEESYTHIPKVKVQPPNMDQFNRLLNVEKKVTIH